MSRTRSRTDSSEGSLMQDVPGGFPDSGDEQTATQLSLSQAIHARRSEYTRPKTIKVKVGSWNVASYKGSVKDIGAWFVQGKGIASALTGLRVSSPGQPHGDSIPDASALDDRETVESQEARYSKKKSTVPKDDPGSEAGGADIDLYCLGLQEVVDVNSASEALRPFTDPGTSHKWKSEIETVLPNGYQLIAEQQLIGMLLLIYASPTLAPDIKSVSTTSVGTGLMGYMGNKGAVTARLVLGDTTRIVFINCHLAAGADKASLDRRNWDYSQVLSRTKFDPIQDSMDLQQNTGEMIDDADIAFWVGDLNYRIVGIPGEDVRRLLMLHTRNEYDLSQKTAGKIEHEISVDAAAAARRTRGRSSTESTTSTTSSAQSTSKRTSNGEDHASSAAEIVEEHLDPNSDPASLQTTIASLLSHDELHEQMKSRHAFHDGWKEGDITFLPTYKYDPGSVGVFDSSEKRRAPSWCDRILYRTRRDQLTYKSMLAEEEASRKKDADMQKSGMDEAGKDEELLYDYDPDADGDDAGSINGLHDAPEGVVITKEGFEDELHLESYTAHQRVLSSDHKPLDAIFSLRYDAVIPELKARVHQDIVRQMDKAENEGRPSVTVVVDKHRNDDEVSDEDPAKFEGVWFGHVRYAVHKHRTITIANTGRVPAQISFADRPVGPGQTPGISPSWLTLRIEDDIHGGGVDRLRKVDLEPGNVCVVSLIIRILDHTLAQLLNEGIKKLDDILVLRVENGRDHFIPVRGKWLRTSVGQSISKLIRIPEGGIRKLQGQKPDSSKTRDQHADDLPVRWSAPRELFRLTEAAETLTEATIAEWGMTASDTKPPWSDTAGWPFPRDVDNPIDDEEAVDDIAKICNALDEDLPLDGHYVPATPISHKLRCLASFLHKFIESIPDGVVTEELWKQIEEYMVQVERQKKPPSDDEQRTALQEILSQSSAHSISFVLVTSMLERIINEIVTSTTQARELKDKDLPKMQSPTRGTLKRMNTSKDVPTAFRQITLRAMASTFADPVIRTPAPVKEKDKTVLEERKVRFIELFLNSGSR